MECCKCDNKVTKLVLQNEPIKMLKEKDDIDIKYFVPFCDKHFTEYTEELRRI